MLRSLLTDTREIASATDLPSRSPAGSFPGDPQVKVNIHVV